MTMYAVSSVGIYRDKYTPITNSDGTMKVQNEIIDTNTNELFSDCETVFEISYHNPRIILPYLCQQSHFELSLFRLDL